MCCSQQTRLKENTSEKFKMKAWAKGMAANGIQREREERRKSRKIHLIIYRVEWHTTKDILMRHTEDTLHKKDAEHSYSQLCAEQLNLKTRRPNHRKNRGHIPEAGTVISLLAQDRWSRHRKDRELLNNKVNVGKFSTTKTGN